MSDEWITGEALKAVIGLNELRPGDEVLVVPDPAVISPLKPAKASWFANEERLAVITHHQQQGVVVLTCPCTPKCGVRLAWGLEYIKGWRRPNAQKT